MKKRYDYGDFLEVPEPLLKTLEGLGEYRLGNPFPPGYRHGDIAGEPEARSVLRELYRERYPRSWRRKFDARRISRPRTETRRERLYAMPRPLCWWDGRNRYQQYFVMPAQGSVCQGGGAGSSQRETQSLFGFAFARADGKRRIPTHILVYDRHNRLQFVDTVKRLCLAPYDMGSNYDLPRHEARNLMKKVLEATTAGDIGRIDAVCIGSS